MQAARLHAIPTSSLPVERVEEPRPGADELLVEVDACGICGTDLHIMAGSSYRPELPFILGHEPAGVVIAAGDPGDASWVGRRVVPTNFRGDGTCRWCLAGDERLCPDLQGIVGVLGIQGGFAERMVIGVSQAVEIPDGLNALTAAALVDAGPSAVNGVQRAVRHAPQTAVVAGGGPIGWLAAALLRAEGIDVLVVEPQARRRTALESVGHRVAADLAEVELRPDAVLDCAGAPAVARWAIERLAPRGVLVLVGYTSVPELDLAPVARKELSVEGIRSGRREDLERALALAAAGELEMPVIRAWPLEAIDEAFVALRRGEVDGKAVITIREQAAT